MYFASPFGSRRDDIRAAFHTAHVLAANSANEFDGDEFSELVRGLSRYLECDQERDPEDETADLEALERMIQERKKNNGWTS